MNSLSKKNFLFKSSILYNNASKMKILIPQFEKNKNIIENILLRKNLHKNLIVSIEQDYSKSNKSFIKFQNKNFLIYNYHGFLSEINFKLERKEEVFFDIDEPIIFDKAKLCILKQNRLLFGCYFSKEFFTLSLLIIFSIYRIGANIMQLSLIKSALWTGLFVFSVRLKGIIDENVKHIIEEIYILEDGKTCEIVLKKETFKVDIKNIRRLTADETLLFQDKSYSYKINYIPLFINSNLYLIPISSNVIRKDFLGFISNGRSFKFNEIINNKNSIEI